MVFPKLPDVADAQAVTLPFILMPYLIWAFVGDVISGGREPTRLQGSRPERLHFGERGIGSFRLLEQGRNPRLLAA